MRELGRTLEENRGIWKGLFRCALTRSGLVRVRCRRNSGERNGVDWSGVSRIKRRHC